VLSSAYQSNLGLNNQVTSITGGFGIRTKKNFYIDFALVNSATKNYNYSPYTVSDNSQPVVNLKSKMMTGIITAGFTF
jgi:hypothetical protein